MGQHFTILGLPREQMMLRGWLTGGIFVGLLASVLLGKPGAVLTLQNQSFSGDVTEDEKYYYIDSPGGQLKLDKRNVKSVHYASGVDDEYAARHAKLGPKDVRGRIELGNWANDKQRMDLAIVAFTEATQIDPGNRAAALGLQEAERQQDLDLAAKHRKEKLAAATRSAATRSAATRSAATRSVGLTAPSRPVSQVARAQSPRNVSVPRRLLTSEEINAIRQKEMSSDDPAVKVKFENNVVKKFLATGDRDAKAFAQMSATEQALEILDKGDPILAKDVKILTDPAPIAFFRTKVQPIIASGCGSTACHGGTRAGAFGIYTGDSVPVAYTNFYILQNFQATIDGAKYKVIDRETPERSLVFQFGLPASIGTPPHPKVPGWRPRFRTDQEAAYKAINDWMSTSLSVFQPNYGIHVGVSLPTTQPIGLGETKPD